MDASGLCKGYVGCLSFPLFPQTPAQAGVQLFEGRRPRSGYPPARVSADLEGHRAHKHPDRGDPSGFDRLGGSYETPM